MLPHGSEDHLVFLNIKQKQLFGTHRNGIERSDHSEASRVLTENQKNSLPKWLQIERNVRMIQLHKLYRRLDSFVRNTRVLVP